MDAKETKQETIAYLLQSIENLIDSKIFHQHEGDNWSQEINQARADIRENLCLLFDVEGD